MHSVLPTNEFGTHVDESIDLLDKSLSELVGNSNDEELAECNNKDSSHRADDRIDNADDLDDILLVSDALHFNPHNGYK